MAQQTRLGVSGFSRAPYGSFSGKSLNVTATESTVVTRGWFEPLSAPGWFEPKSRPGYFEPLATPQRI